MRQGKHRVNKSQNFFDLNESIDNSPNRVDAVTSLLTTEIPPPKQRIENPVMKSIDFGEITQIEDFSFENYKNQVTNDKFTTMPVDKPKET